MRQQDWPRAAGLASFSVIAVGFAAFLLSAGDQRHYVEAAAILLLAAGQFAAMIFGWIRMSQVIERQSMQGRALREMAEETRSLSMRLEAIETGLAAPEAPKNDDTVSEMQALREQLEALARDIERPREHAPQETPPPTIAAENPAPRQSPGERLDLLLEPVIELANGETAHYRALLNMVDDAGNEVPHGELMRKAEEGGMRPALDVHLLGQVLPVLRKLRVKHPAMRLFVPVGPSTLTTDLDRIFARLEESADIAAGVVIELHHGDLAALSARGIEGLANLGRLGVTMSLTQASLAGLDLNALRQLGVRYLDFDARSFDSGFGATPSWTEFAQFARAMRFQVIGGGVEIPAQAAAAGRIARFGYGPYFAPPRRVRTGAGQNAESAQYQAA